MLGLVFGLLSSLSVHAQLDPGTAVLLKGQRSPSAAELGVQSGRYQIKPIEDSTDSGSLASPQIALKPKKTKKSQKLPIKEITGAQLEPVFIAGEESAIGVSVAPKVPTALGPSQGAPRGTETAQKSNSVEKLAFKPAEKNTDKPADKSEPTKIAEKEKPETVDMQPPPVASQLVDLVSGQGQPFLEAYKEQVHPDDIRLNTIELQFLPGLLYNDSKANYSFRSYQTFSPKYSLGAKFWLTPFIGFHGDIANSLAADVAGADRSRIAAKHESTEVGLDFRRYFGLSRRSNSIEFGVHYHEYKFTVPGDETTRTNLKSSGLGLHVLARLPTAPSYAWTIEGKVVPKLSATESPTGVTVASGGAPESSRFGLAIGGEIKFSRQHQMILELGYSIEKNQYSGIAAPADLESGFAPNGVSVTNSMLSFSFGYRWGQ